MARAANHRGAFVAVLGASVVHAVLFLVWQADAAQQVPDRPEPEILAMVELVSAPHSSNIKATDSTVSLSPLASVGALDRVAGDPQWTSNQNAMAPGTHTGSAAPGTRGRESFTSRDDESYRSKGLWNSFAVSQMQHTNSAAIGRSSPEALERQPEPAFADRRVHTRRAQVGEEVAQKGLPEQNGQGGTVGLEGSEWFAIDPRFDSAPTQKNQSANGALQVSTEATRSERGTLSTENVERGPARENLDSPARSTLRNASPFDLGAPSRGSDEDRVGAGGRSGQSTSHGAGKGTAAQVGATGNELGSTEASRSIPYFYAMYRRIDKELHFPHELALNLEQGETVLRFQLDQKGNVRMLKVQKSSGFKEFDSEAKRAFLAAAPFGPMPKTLHRGRERLTVIAPYYFRNPLIR